MQSLLHPEFARATAAEHRRRAQQSDPGSAHPARAPHERVLRRALRALLQSRVARTDPPAARAGVTPGSLEVEV
jgi:hypothetical protein